MDIKRIIWFSLLFAGEALIIVCFLYFGSNADSRILTLNIIVSSIIYLFSIINGSFPKIDLKVKSHKAAGSLGLRWFSIFLYSIAAITAMLIFNIVKPVSFNSQLIIQLILFFLLLFGLYMSLTAAHKVHKVYIEEKHLRSCLKDIHKATDQIQIKLNQLKEIPVEICTKITTLQENFRYISPSNNEEALELELNFLNEINAINDYLFDISGNRDKIMGILQNCDRIYIKRKQLFSN